MSEQTSKSIESVAIILAIMSVILSLMYYVHDYNVKALELQSQKLRIESVKYKIILSVKQDNDKLENP